MYSVFGSLIEARTACHNEDGMLTAKYYLRLIMNQYDSEINKFKRLNLILRLSTQEIERYPALAVNRAMQWTAEDLRWVLLSDSGLVRVGRKS